MVGAWNGGGGIPPLVPGLPHRRLQTPARIQLGAGMGIPTVEVLLLLFLPYVDRKPGGVGKWFSRERLPANSLFITFALINIGLIVIGTCFRGPNWEFVSPW
jgi:hypothetical protein